jgi:hypothetical protein
MVLITHPLQNGVSAFLPIPYPSRISGRFLRHVLVLAQCYSLSVVNSERAAGAIRQGSLGEGENRRTPQEVHLQLSPQEPPEQHLQSPHGPIF